MITDRIGLHSVVLTLLNGSIQINFIPGQNPYYARCKTGLFQEQHVGAQKRWKKIIFALQTVNSFHFANALSFIFSSFQSSNS